MKFRAVIGLGLGILGVGKVAMRVTVMEVAERLRIVKFSGGVIGGGVEELRCDQASCFDFLRQYIPVGSPVAICCEVVVVLVVVLMGSGSEPGIIIGFVV